MSSKPQYQSPPPPPQHQPPQPPYSQGPPPYRPPPTDKGISRTLLIVIIVVVILVIVIPIILSAVLYFMVSDMITNGGQTEPNVNIDDGEATGAFGEWRLEIAAVSSAEALGLYKVTVLNGTTVAISALDLQNVKNAGDTGVSGGGLTLEFTDVTDDGKLNGGDWFILSGTDSTSDYQVAIYWKASGNKVSGTTGQIQQ